MICTKCLSNVGGCHNTPLLDTLGSRDQGRFQTVSLNLIHTNVDFYRKMFRKPLNTLWFAICEQFRRQSQIFAIHC